MLDLARNGRHGLAVGVSPRYEGVEESLALAPKGRHGAAMSCVAPLGLRNYEAIGFRGLTPTAKSWRRFAAGVLRGW